MIAFHCAVAGNNILYNTGENMPDVGLSVCSGRTVIKRKLRLALIPVGTFLKYVVFLPKRENCFFPVAEIKTGINFLVHNYLHTKNKPRAFRKKAQGKTAK